VTKNKWGLSRLSNRIEPSRKWTLDFCYRLQFIQALTVKG
jgi:hypothetical protein